jgi:alcohol dehydrogenase class IV
VNPFEVTMPGKVIFGSGSISKLGVEVKPHASRVLLISGGNFSRAQKALESLKEAGVEATLFAVKGEPTLEVVREGVRSGKEAGCQGVAAIGGGSVLDAGKAIAAMMANPGDLLEYLEVIGAGKPLVNPPVFFTAVPTTAGTGTEATRNAVLTSMEHKVKVSLRHPSMVPKVAFLDPKLTISLPPEITAATGMDALCQLIEAFTCKTPNPFTDALCREGMGRASHSLLKVFKDGNDLSAREDMVLAGHFSGIALANAKLGAVHGFAAPLGGMYNAPHGALCAALLPAVLTVNQKAIIQREPDSPVLGRYREVADILSGGKSKTNREEAADYCEGLRKELKIRRLENLGVRRVDFDVICEKASSASSMKGNPVDLTMKELKEILEIAF